MTSTPNWNSSNSQSEPYVRGQPGHVQGQPDYIQGQPGHVQGQPGYTPDGQSSFVPQQYQQFSGFDNSYMSNSAYVMRKYGKRPGLAIAAAVLAFVAAGAGFIQFLVRLDILSEQYYGYYVSGSFKALFCIAFIIDVFAIIGAVLGGVLLLLRKNNIVIVAGCGAHLVSILFMIFAYFVVNDYDFFLGRNLKYSKFGFIFRIICEAIFTGLIIAFSCAPPIKRWLKIHIF